MKERPILFSGPMVRAILDGSKTQTRRVAKPRHGLSLLEPGCWSDSYVLDPENREWLMKDNHYGIPGDRLWVRETWAVQHEYDAFPPSAIPASARWHYAATEDLGGLLKRPSIFLPRRGSRILLEITDVRVQRLHEISDDDARAEGYDRSHAFPREWFALLWERINGDGSWNANPWVWAITFRRVP